ncbi:lysoplasmalogenase family protein [Aquimarina longa]|uniref:lysoplasmalogenase family protein n=1 Tax=Aquimarina longa TaxID=1080221 RepID=UPI00078681C7|nr:lysoplasmalogenase family protein [Aquimarina longa]
MKIRTLIKVLLLITGGLCVMSKIMNWPTLEFYIKPTTVPLFFMLYWFNVKKIDLIFLLVLFLCFLGDVFLLADIQNSFMYVLSSYSVSYLLLFYFLYKNYRPLNYDTTDVIYLIIFLISWSFISYKIYDVVYEAMGDIRCLGLLYLLILYFLFIGAVFQYINSRSTKSLWFLIAILNFVISDSCYALNKYYVPSIEFEIINSIYQLLAVFFLVKFKISSPTSLRLKQF